ncbi:hypothetical protein, partial [Escherichia coli]|uniref:hypothetical protein n=1 Tax=Escherichia coli TaxID=562 RepID=UPI00201F96EE
RQKQKKLIMLPSETMIWQPEFTDKTLSRKPGAVQTSSGIRFVIEENWANQNWVFIQHSTTHQIAWQLWTRLLEA